MYKESKYNIRVQDSQNLIVYNSISKASIRFFNTNEVSLMDLENNLKKVLFDQGFLVDENKDETKYLNYLFNKSYFDSDFLNIVMVPSLRCNFNCPYCFEHTKGNCIKEIGVPQYFETLYNFSKKIFDKYPDIELSMFGGEPLLFADSYFDYFSKVFSDFPKKQITTSIVTNGSLLTEDIVLKLLHYNCRSIQVTIDGWKKAHNFTRCFNTGEESYDIIIKNINNLLPILPDSCTFNLRINLNNITIDEVENSLNDIDINYRDKVNILFRPIYNTQCFVQRNSNKLNELKPYLSLAKNKGFSLVKNSYLYQACESCSGDDFFYIMPDLSLWKCINDLTFEQAKIGEIDSNCEPIFDADKLVNWHFYSSDLDAKCENCKLLPDCYGGCVLYKAKNGKRNCKEFAMSSAPYLFK